MRLAPALLSSVLICSVPAFGDTGLSLLTDGPTGDIIADVDGRYDTTENVALSLWDWAEVGYQEERSTQLMQDTLSEAGFEIQSGVAGIPTAFVASYGSGGPVIAILAELDALPGINQNASSHRQPIEGKAAGHACGHNLFAAGSITAAISVRDWLDATGTPGTVRVYGTPAEEGGSGKVYMVREGLFEDVDFAIHWHPADRNTASARTSLANRSAKFRFSGLSAHAAGAPERGRSALDGVEAMNIMANMMHEHIDQDARMHYVITAGGNAPNVVPDFAEVFYYVRHPKPGGVEAIWERLENAARGAALGTGTDVEWEIIHGNNPVLVNEPLQKVMHAKLTQVGGVTYTDEERAFAEKIQDSFFRPSLELGSEETIEPYNVSLGYGSTDVGDVSYAVPTVGVGAATWVPGTSAHSWQAVAASGMSIGVKGSQVAAKSMALTAIELYLNDDLRMAARADFDAARGEDYEYRSLLGDRDPPLDYRN
ncbi:MAG: amidohydrolase [Pseudomonadota bacterium]